MQEIDNRKRIRGLLALVLSMLMIFGYSGSIVFAVEKDSVPKLPEGSYTLALSLVSTNPDGSKTGIKDADISIYQVASLSIKSDAAIYSATDDFASAGVDFEGMSASESNSAAKLFAKIVSEKNLAGSGSSGNSSETGEVNFNDLSAGIYLVMLDRYDTKDGRYTEMDPFLVLVPGIDRSDNGNKWISNVSVSPKIAISPRDYLEVNPPVVKKVEGNDNAKDVFTFELAADDISNPMPVGARNGKKQVTITGAGETEFGTWRYTEPGTYKYLIREVPGTNTNYKYDGRVYHLTDTISYSGSKLHLNRTVADEDGNTYGNDETAVFEFVNKYNKPVITIVPKTGDDVKTLIWALIALLSAVIAMIISVRKKREYLRRK